MGSSVLLRPAVAADIPDLQRVGREADTRFAAVGHPELADGAAIPTDAALRAIARGGIVVATLEGRVVGFAYVGRVGAELCLGQISVEPAAGRRGVGSALVEAVLAKARADGEPSVVLSTQRDVAWNMPWFARHGFAVVEPRDHDAALRAVVEEQTADGVDWTDRVHMRVTFGRDARAGG